MHELAQSEIDQASAHLVVVSSRKSPQPTLIRCPSCKGLRSCYPRWETRVPGKCDDCKAGRVVTREVFYGWWLEHFTTDELEELSRAIGEILVA